MKLTVFSWPYKLEDELIAVKTLLNEGLESFHLRKPEWDITQNREFLNKLTPEEQKRIIIHQHFNLLDEFNLKGIHFSSKNTFADNICKRKDINMVFSQSIHSIAEYKNLPREINRVFIGPVFKSISKSNYPGQFEKKELKDFLLQKHTKKLFALGGIDENNIAKTKELGFDGAGILGAIWSPFQDKGINEVKSTFLKIRKNLQN